jgi:hypothetical protein
VCCAGVCLHSPSMSLSALAAVELQLIMQCCDLKLILALARCCRFTLASASSGFAWRKLSPLQIPLEPATVPWLLPVPSSLLRFCDLSLTFQSLGDKDSAVDVDAAFFDALRALPRLFELRIKWSYQREALHQMKQWMKCLECCRASLSSLLLPELKISDLAEPCTTLIASRLGALRTLDIDASLRADVVFRLPGQLGSLLHLSLRNLHLCSNSALAAVDQCTQLVSLSLRFCRIKHVVLLLSMPALRSIRYLTMTEVDCLDYSALNSDTPVDTAVNPWTSCFPSCARVCAFR